MAVKQTKKLKVEDFGTLPQQPANDAQKVLANLLENWKQYAGGAALVIFCLLAYAIYQAEQSSKELAANSLYAKAFIDDDDDNRVALLQEAIALNSSLQHEIRYVLGQQAIRMENYEMAKEELTIVLNESKDEQLIAKAASSLAFLKENDGDFEGAIAAYQELRSNWPDSLEALLAPSKIAKLNEKIGNVEAAVATHREQIELFPDSKTAEASQAELDRIKIRHPEFFPEDEELKLLSTFEAPISPPTEITDTVSLDGSPTDGEAVPESTTEESGEVVESEAMVEELPSDQSAVEPASEPAVESVSEPASEISTAPDGEESAANEEADAVTEEAVPAENGAAIDSTSEVTTE